MADDHYRQFVDQAFIDPIRSVLIVDDDYPTFEEMLSKQESSKEWRNQSDRVLGVIRGFRERNLLVDIHDCQNVRSATEIAKAEHLHQSDLLVLDYQLDKTKKGDGTIAIDIIRKLMSNSHFNLVVVHTTENLDAVFEDIIIALLPQESCEIKEEDPFEIAEILQSAKISVNNFDERLANSVSRKIYIKLRQVGYRQLIALYMKSAVIFNDFRSICEEAGWNIKTQHQILRHQLYLFDQTIVRSPGVPTAKQIDWSEDTIKWARSDTVFIAFSSKNVGETPLEDLSAALNAWRPDPSRLYLARLLHEIEEHGTAKQAQVLRDKPALAGWYHTMLTAEEDATRTQIDETIARHSERLMRSVGPNVAEFAERLIRAERAVDAERPDTAYEICKTHFKIDLNNKADLVLARSHHNSVVSTKPPEGWHLTTGHIFKFADRHWVCASPACDMVPGQLSKFRKDIYGKRMPFTAIHLQPAPLENALLKATGSRMLFLEIDGKIKAFSFNDPSDDTSSPQWSTFFAEKLGAFDTTTYEFKIVQVESDDKAQLTVKTHDAKVVSQLRYEYALNLVQRLGVSMSRIGLDFSAFVPPEVKSDKQ